MSAKNVHVCVCMYLCGLFECMCMCDFKFESTNRKVVIYRFRLKILTFLMSAPIHGLIVCMCVK